MFYAGIGSRETPSHVLKLMASLARYLESKGYVLRSGGADGADRAFEYGVEERKAIYRPNDCTPEALELSSQYHPAWHRCNDYVKRLHGRNAMIILGARLDNPAKFVLCWTPEGSGSGGTGQGLRIAKAHGIPIIDLGSDTLEKLFSST